MIEMKKQPVKLAHINVRTEIHGDETETGLDLKFTMKASNDILSMIDPNLKNAFYYNSDENMELDLEDDRKPNLRFPLLCKKAFDWEYKTAGYRVVLYTGIDDEGDIFLKPCKISGFKFTFIEGGTVEVVFKVQLNPVDDDTAKLVEVLNQSMDITLEPPSEDVASFEDLD